MAGNTVPWWRKAVQFVLKSIRLVARGDDRSKGARSATTPSPAASSQSAIEEPAVEKIETGASRELQVEEETALKQSPEKLPEESPKPDPEVTPDSVHTPAEASSSHADAAGEARAAAEQSASEPDEAMETDETSQTEDAAQSPEEVPESPADLLAEAALGMPAEDDLELEPEPTAETLGEQPAANAAEEEIEEVPSSPADILAEAGVEREEPEAIVTGNAVTGNIEKPADATATGPEGVEAMARQEEAEPEAETAVAAEELPVQDGADVEAPEIEAVEEAFDQPFESAAEEGAEAVVAEDAVGESEAEVESLALPADAELAQSTEALEVPAIEGEQQESEAAPAEDSAAVSESPKLAPQAAAAPQATQAAPAHAPVKREEGPDTSPVSVIVSQVYEGPLDLLLDLIRKQDIDIYDIPIAKITAQFLAYVNHLKASDMDVAGEFIYTASLLIHIKSKMLLPRAPSGPDDAAEDPRRELVERLLEHERFKNAAQMLQQKQMLEAATWTNPGMREFRDDAARRTGDCGRHGGPGAHLPRNPGAGAQRADPRRGRGLGHRWADDPVPDAPADDGGQAGGAAAAAEPDALGTGADRDVSGVAGTGAAAGDPAAAGSSSSARYSSRRTRGLRPS